MTTPRPTPFPATTPRAGVLKSFIILSNSDDAITTLPIRLAPPSPDYDDSPSKDSMETTESLHTQIASTLVVPPPSLLPSSSSPPPPPPPKRVELVRDDHDVITRDSLRTARGRITRLQLRAVYAEQEALELWEFRVTDRLKILQLRSLAKYVEARLEKSHEWQTGDGVRTQRTEMIEQDIKILHARAEAAEDLIESRRDDKLEMAELRSRAQDIEASFWDLGRTMSTTNQWMNFAKIEMIVTQRVANIIETIAIYETKTRTARDSMNWVERQEDNVAKNVSDKRKWEGDHGGSSIQQQNKRHKVIRAHAVGSSNKKRYAGTLPLYNKYKFHHTSSCTAKCGNYKRVGHQTRDCRA
ncbi:hypothetical protein Tco_0146050 [Tanacetum coccineum]